MVDWACSGQACAFCTYDQCSPGVWSLWDPSRIASVVNGCCLWSDRSLYGWIGPESEAASLACRGGEFQDLVMARRVLPGWSHRWASKRSCLDEATPLLIVVDQ